MSLAEAVAAGTMVAAPARARATSVLRILALPSWWIDRHRVPTSERTSRAYLTPAWTFDLLVGQHRHHARHLRGRVALEHGPVPAPRDRRLELCEPALGPAVERRV